MNTKMMKAWKFLALGGFAIAVIIKVISFGADVNYILLIALVCFEMAKLDPDK